jgi:ATP synthase protein I
MDKKDWGRVRRLGELRTIGLTMVLSTVVGLAMGVGLDRWLGFTSPWGTLFFLLLGIVAGFYNLFKVLRVNKK